MSALASRVASARLDEHHRRALELRERDGAGYAQIASELGVAPREVAELLVDARLRLREAVRDRPLPAITGEDCRRARALLCARQDREPVAREDGGFLRAHVDGCEGCRGARIALREGSLALRAALEADPEAFSAARVGAAPAARERAAVPVPASPAPAPAVSAPAAPAPAVSAPAAPAPVPAVAASAATAPAPSFAASAATAPAVAPAPAAPSPERADRRARRERQRRPRRVPAFVAVTVLAAFVATMTTIFVGGDDPATSSATGRPEATAEPAPTQPLSRGTATVDTAAERRAAERRRARARRERAARRRRAAAAATPAATATPAPVATAVPEATAAPDPQATPKRDRKPKRQPQREPADDGTETRPGQGGAVIPQPTDPTNPDGKPDVIPDSCTEDNPDCESG